MPLSLFFWESYKLGNAVPLAWPLSLTSEDFFVQHLPVKIMAHAMYGFRLMPQILDSYAKTTPERIYALIPRGFGVEEGWKDISFKDMARCANFMVEFMTKKVGESLSFETVAYIGIPDLRAAAVFLGAVKVGFKVEKIIYPIVDTSILIVSRFYSHPLGMLPLLRFI